MKTVIKLVVVVFILTIGIGFAVSSDVRDGAKKYVDPKLVGWFDDMKDRVGLIVAGTKQVIINSLNLLGIKVPEVM